MMGLFIRAKGPYEGTLIIGAEGPYDVATFNYKCLLSRANSP